MMSREMPENTAEYDEDGDSDATVGDRILELWLNAGGRDDGVQGLRDTEDGVRQGECLLGVRRAALPRRIAGGAARGGAALRPVPEIAEPVGTEGLSA